MSGTLPDVVKAEIGGERVSAEQADNIMRRTTPSTAARPMG